jgi:hypothetical protein
MLANVQQTTIKPIIEAGVAKGALIHTDEYDIYARLPAWGYEHKTVCHGRGEYARDADGDGMNVHAGDMSAGFAIRHHPVEEVAFNSTIDVRGGEGFAREQFLRIVFTHPHHRVLTYVVLWHATPRLGLGILALAEKLTF